MKLRTEINRSGITAGSDDEYTRDAMTAHALMLAIKEWWGRPPEDDSCADAAVTWIEMRSDELMREWGFDPRT